MTRTLILGALVAMATVGCATTQNAPADTRAASNSLDAQKIDRMCIKDTGTRIKRPEGDKSCVMQPGRTYSQRELEDTGRIDVADALRALDPSLQ
jgi:hypothetical protein